MTWIIEKRSGKINIYSDCLRRDRIGRCRKGFRRRKCQRKALSSSILVLALARRQPSIWQVSRDLCLHVQVYFCWFFGPMLFLSWALPLSEGSTLKAPWHYVLNHEFTHRLWTVANYLSTHQFQILLKALGIQQTRQLGFLLYGAFSIMGEKDIKQIIANVKCCGGEAQAVMEM